jgi:hypothetical protein
LLEIDAAQMGGAAGTTVPNVVGSDLAFNQAIRSLAVWGGNALLPRIQSGEASSSEIG